MDICCYKELVCAVACALAKQMLVVVDKLACWLPWYSDSQSQTNGRLQYSQNQSASHRIGVVWSASNFP